MLWLLTLPFRIVFGVIVAVVALALSIALLPLALVFLVPLLLLRGVCKVAGALLLAGALGVALLLLFALALLPLIPIMLLIGCVWLLVRLTRPRPVVSYPPTRL